MVPQQGFDTAVPPSAAASIEASRTPASPVVEAVAHCVPAGMQQRLPAPPAGVQSSDPQQSEFTLHPRSPAGRHVTARRQTFASQVVPAQHSVLSTQLSPSASHAQRPPSQSMSPQHSRLFEHVPPCRWQHRSSTGAARQS